MSRFRFLGTLFFMVPVLAVALATAGCGGDSSPKKGDADKTGKKGDGGGATPSVEKGPLKPAGFATIKGKVAFDGTPPPPADIAIPDNNENKQYCLKGPHTDPTWTVGADKGVANVVLWVRAPAGKYFDVPADQQKPVEPIIKIDQPFCAFQPHVSVAFPSFFDGKTQKQTGQKLEVANSAPFNHNTNWTPSNTLLDSGANVMLESKQTREIPLFDLPSAKKRSGLEDLLSLKCNIHQWMTGYIWAFDHPYAAVTKEDGTYEIKNVPAGSELQLVGWHEAADYFLPGGQKGQKIEPLKGNEVKEMNFTIKK